MDQEENKNPEVEMDPLLKPQKHNDHAFWQSIDLNKSYIARIRVKSNEEYITAIEFIDEKG
jgi:hypothetical protein